MRITRFLALVSIFTFSLSTSYSQTDSFSAQLKLKNTGSAIDNVVGDVIVSGGQAPYKYIWNQQDISIYHKHVENLPEGEEIKVTVVDVKGDSAVATGYIETESFSENINRVMKPAVAAMSYVLFANIWSDTVMIEKYTLTAPFALDTEKKDYTLVKWLKNDGDKVEHLEPIAILRDGKREFPLYAIENGVLHYASINGEKVKPGDKVYYTNKKGHRDAKPLATLTYNEPTPYLFKNLTTQITGIPLIVIWLILGALFFTIRFGFPQFKGFKHAIALIRGKHDDPNEDQGEISHFQALVTALSATIGLGNIAGIAIAISLGGAGASFWIIIAGFLGMAAKFAECTLGVKYRIRKENGEVSGGPMYYLRDGLAKKGPFYKKLGKVLAVLFAILCIGGSLGGGNMFQANQAFSQIASIPELQWLGQYGFYFGIGMAILVGVVIIGGIKSIARVTDKIVPLMVAIYVTFALLIIGMNYENIGSGFKTIFYGAFNSDAIYGGVIGVLIIGLQRAAFSNEAGIGSASIAHSAAKTKEPVSEGIVALVEPFIDTVVVCTMTALVIIFTGYAQQPEGLTGSELTTAAFSFALGDWTLYVLSFAVFLFAFSTMISWSYYGLKSFTFLFGDNKYTDTIYKSIYLIFIVVGTSIGLGSVLDFSDLMILGMAFPNILGLLLLSGEVRKDFKEYMIKVKTGVIKRFK